MARGGGNKKRYQYCTDSSGAILYTRALQGHSGRSLIDPTLQDNVVIPSDFFHFIHHVGCAINLHSIINSGLIPGGRNLSNRQTVFFQPVDPMDKNHKDSDTIDLNAPRHAQYMHKAWKKHQNTVYWVDFNLALKKKLKFYQTRSNAIILHVTLPAYCIPKVVRMEIGEVIYEKVHVSPRLPPKDLLETWLDERIGFRSCSKTKGQVAQQSKSSQSNQLNPSPVHDRTGTPVVCRDASHAQGARKTRSSDDSKSFIVGDEKIMIERRHPLFAVTQVTRKVTSKQCWTRWTWTSEFQGYHILLWSMLRAHAFENWLRKSRTTQIDMLFNKIYDKTKPTTRSVGVQENDSGHGQRELFELFESDPLIILEWRHRLLHMRASLERNSGQSKFHCVYAGISFNSRICNQEGKTLWPQIWETSRKQRISPGPIIWKRNALKDKSKESMIYSCEIMLSVNGWSKTLEMKMLVVHAKQDHTYHMSESQAKLVDHSQ